ncbi:hypothetical protein MKW92_048764, partial [Papaver armeniacum]
DAANDIDPNDGYHSPESVRRSAEPRVFMTRSITRSVSQGTRSRTRLFPQ